VKIKATPEELGIETIGDAAALGAAAAVYLNVFTQGFKLGSQVDVSATVRAPQAPGVEEAARLLEEGLGGVTELPEGTEDRSHEERPYVEDGKPWDQKVDAKPKPWEADETQAPKPAVVVSADW
jgi:hypothetical protein